MKKKLDAEKIEGWTWLDVFKYYDKKFKEKDVEFVMWNETSHPFSDAQGTLNQIHSYFKNRKTNK